MAEDLGGLTQAPEHARKLWEVAGMFAVVGMVVGAGVAINSSPPPHAGQAFDPLTSTPSVYATQQASGWVELTFYVAHMVEFALLFGLVGAFVKAGWDSLNS